MSTKTKETKIIGTPTANGVIKGRPGKGRVLSLEQRKNCYSGHRMTADNTFRYTAKRIKGKAKPIERAWCRKCRATSRKSSAESRRLREATEAKAAKRDTNAAIKAATSAKKSATSAKPKRLTAAKGSKGSKGSKDASARRVKTGKAAKVKGSKAA